MEFSKHGCLVTGLLEDLREGDVCRIEWKMVVNFPVEMAMLSGQNSRPRRGTNGISDTGIGKQHAHFGNPIDVGSFDQVIAVGRNRLIGMIIGHDENDVGAL